MTRIVVDLERLKHLECGLGQYCLHLGRNLLEQSPPDWEPVFLLPPRAESYFLPHRPLSIAAQPWRKDAIARWLRPWQRQLPRPLRADLWHVTHQDSKYWPVDASIPVVWTIHDLNFLREKSAAVIQRRLQRLRRRLARAQVITTGSEFAAAEIRQHLPIGERAIQVIPHGVCLDSRVAPAPLAAVPTDRPFLFSIGEIAPKKNFHVLVEMLARLPEYDLVIAGSKSHGYAAEMERRASELGVAARVILPGRVSEAERNWLYAHCTAFLFPSLTEGFGLPLIEAMSFGRPVFSSRHTSLPEVGGTLVFYFDAFDPDAMAHCVRTGMQQFTADPTLGERLRARAREFSWPQAAARYWRLYQDIVEATAGMADRR